MRMIQRWYGVRLYLALLGCGFAVAIIGAVAGSCAQPHAAIEWHTATPVAGR